MLFTSKKDYVELSYGDETMDGRCANVMVFVVKGATACIGQSYYQNLVQLSNILSTSRRCYYSS